MNEANTESRVTSLVLSNDAPLVAEIVITEAEALLFNKRSNELLTVKTFTMEDVVTRHVEISDCVVNIIRLTDHNGQVSCLYNFTMRNKTRGYTMWGSNRNRRAYFTIRVNFELKGGAVIDQWNLKSWFFCDTDKVVHRRESQEEDFFDIVEGVNIEFITRGFSC